VSIGIVGVPLLLRLHWLAESPDASGFPYVRWPNRSGASTVATIGFVIFLLLGVFVFFEGFLTYATARYGPANLRRRTVASLALAGATVTLALDWAFLIHYLSRVSYLASPN